MIMTVHRSSLIRPVRA